MGQNIELLFIEDNTSDQLAFTRFVKKNGLPYSCTVTGSVVATLVELSTKRFDIVITDYLLGDGTAFDLFGAFKETPFILVTGYGLADMAVRAMKAGAYDYLIKDQEYQYLTLLPTVVENALNRKQDKERLRLMESAALNANDAIVIIEAEGHNHSGRRILYVNWAFTRMTGYAAEEVINETLGILNGEKTSDKEIKKIGMALDGAKSIRGELINYRKDGAEFWVEYNMMPVVGPDGSPTHWVSIHRDITERKKAEEERERLLNKIEEINRDLTELTMELEGIGTERTMGLLALMLADRVRNPAVVIGNTSRRILERETVSDSLKERLQVLFDEAGHLESIVRDFESLQKKRQAIFRYHDINELLTGIISTIEKEFSLKGIKPDIKLSEAPLKINMQKELLRVAVFHLLRDSIEAMPEGEVLSVVTYAGENQAVISISGTGIFISKEDIGRLFEPGFSLREEGFGLGLPLVKQIVAEHLGRIEIESEPGKGTTFRLIFPLRWS